MAYVQGLPRHQIRMVSLDDMVAPDSIARVVDRFIDGLGLGALGFREGAGVCMGRSPYDPRVMAKILVFGYLEGIRSSRRLERACSVNTEMMWLADGLAPDHKTIANFRKDNLEAIQALFGEFGSFTEYAGLVGKRVLAVDGTKVRACNSKKRMLTKKKLEKQKEHHEARAKEYLDALAEADGDEAAEACRERAAGHAGKAKEAEAKMAALEAAGLSELGLTDADAHNMGDKSTGVRPAYNVQAAVDSEAHIVVAHGIHARAVY
jgi:transposase